MEYFLGIDLGGTMIKASVLDKHYRIIASAVRRTMLPRPWNEILDDCAAADAAARLDDGLCEDYAACADFDIGRDDGTRMNDNGQGEAQHGKTAAEAFADGVAADGHGQTVFGG